MGLDFSHTDAHWPYTSFSHFRRSLAAFEGIALERMAGFTSGGLEWSTVNTPLKPLLNHSDCDGELTPDECRQIAPRLRQVIDELWPADTSTWDINPAASHHRSNGLLLADGMDAAAETGEPLEFC